MRSGDLFEYVVWQVCRVASGARILYEDLLVSTNGRVAKILKTDSPRTFLSVIMTYRFPSVTGWWEGKNQSFSTSVPRIFFANCSGRRFTGNRPFQENEHFFVLNPIATLLLVASTGRQFYSTLEKKKRLPSWECTNVLLLDKFLFCGHHHPLEMSSKSSSPFELNRKQYKN